MANAGKLFADQSQDGLHSQGRTVNSHRMHCLQVSNRIEIQVSPLDEVKRVLAQKALQRLDFFGSIRKSRAVQIIDGHMPLVTDGKIDAGFNILE